MNNQTNSSNNLRSVILLLIAAVILPTVCLLYFMTQAAENDRLAMRQRMVDFYTKKINEVFPLPSEMLEHYYPDWMAQDSIIPPTDLRELELSDTTINSILFSNVSNIGSVDTFVIYDSNDVMVHPAMEGFDTLPDGFDEITAKAYEFEFQDVNIPAAIEEYTKIGKETKDDRVKFAAEIAKVRCFKKIDKKKEAIELATKLSHLDSETIPKHLAGDILRARVLLARLLEKDHIEQYRNTINKLTYRTISPQTHFPSDTRAWALTSLNKFASLLPIYEDPGYSTTQIEKIITMEDMAVSAANIYPSPEAFKDWPDRTYRQIQSDPLLYGVHFGAGGKHFLKVLSHESAGKIFRLNTHTIIDDMVFCRIYDDQGSFINEYPEQPIVEIAVEPGEQPKVIERTLLSGEKFFEVGPGENYPGWKIEFYFHGDTFSSAARRQKLIYVWTGVLLVSLILIVSALAGKSILKQAKLNTLKNDFIATVTHELKTPLASMRVLVDTLLEGNYNDQQQAKEYLELIAKENKRLTGLIDNFLTFSRMERNKQAFEMADCPAANIAEDAAAAVRTKFNGGICKFIVTIDDDLASILADADAMVTVLVNLLDNAYKYSGDEKQIELAVYDENGQVCFAVKDNGIGMSNRAMKKIFERFYQADSRLSRDAEGCGLGLSIVKFIVDAHNGTIEVNSETGKGSTFIVKIPKHTKGN